MKSRSLPLLITALAASLGTLPASGFPFDFSLVNVQPVDAPSPVAAPYDPTVVGANVLFEPQQLTDFTIPSYRANIDFEIRNDGAGWVRLDGLRVVYPGSTMPALQLQGDELLGYDASFYEFPPGDPDHLRPAILDGGFGPTGLSLQIGFDKEDNLPFGSGLDVVAYKPPGWTSSQYAVVGSRQLATGELPDDPMEVATVVDEAFLARYDANGDLVSYRIFPGRSMDELEPLGNGLFLAVGHDTSTGPPGGVMTIRRLRLYEIDQDGNIQASDEINTDTSFGAAGLRTIAFATAEETCQIRSIEGGDQMTGMLLTRYMVAAHLTCGTDERAGLALLDGNGDLVPSFGNQGTLVLAGPGGADVRPVALRARRGIAQPFVAWLAASVGENCGSTIEDCQFGLTRLNLTGQDATYGWFQTTFPEADYAVAKDLEVDAQGRVFVGGYAVTGNVRYASMAGFTRNGLLNSSFGDGGLMGNLIGGRDAAITGLANMPSGDLAAAVTIYHEAAETTSAFGAALFSASGALLWSHDVLQSGNLWRHAEPGQNFNYGAVLEDDNQGMPMAVAVDDQSRLLVVGHAGSELTPDIAGTTPLTVALARYLPFGQPDSRRWIQSGASPAFAIPEDRTFDHPAPDSVRFELDFQGGTLTDWQFERDVEPLLGNFVPSGGYLFPIGAEDLEEDEVAVAGGHPLQHHHRHSAGNRFAYDIGVARWDGAAWTDEVEDPPTEPANSSKLAWNRRVRAMADGEVVSCRRSTPDQDPGERIGEANFVEIQHAFHNVDKSQREYAVYFHLQYDSVPIEICPNICPEDDPECDVETEGVDPDGRDLPTPIPILAGATVGRVGNTGNSSSPHLHVHVTTGAGGQAGDPEAGSIPMLFQQLWLGDRFDDLGNQIEPDPWFVIHNRAIPHRYLVRPFE
jgi:hypothetical protein